MKKKEFTWQGFEEGNIYVHCDTKEKSQDFLNECKDRSLCFQREYKTPYHVWKHYKSNTHYGVDCTDMEDKSNIYLYCASRYKVKQINPDGIITKWSIGRQEDLT